MERARRAHRATTKGRSVKLADPNRSDVAAARQITGRVAVVLLSSAVWRERRSSPIIQKKSVVLEGDFFGAILATSLSERFGGLVDRTPNPKD